jgi:hypothetical protein
MSAFAFESPGGTARRAVLAIGLTFACLTAALPLSLLYPEAAGLPIYVIFLVFCIQLVRLRGGLLDPFLIFSLGTFLYGFVPFIADSANDELIDAFGFQGGQAIFAYAMHAIVFAFLATSILVPGASESTSRMVLRADKAIEYDRLAKIAIVLCAVLSVALESIYVALHGTVLGGDFDYSQGFRERAAAGSGILLLSYPIAVAGLGFVLTSSHRFKLYSYVVSLVPFALLFFVHGERKYLIAPGLLVVARFIKARSFLSILAALLAGAIGWMLFVYLGYLRSREYSIFEMFREDVINGFFNDFRDEIGGETVTLFGTASAAYAGFVKPLPYLGDYLLAWIYAVPQLLVGKAPFVPTADRFATIYAVDRVYDGMGWGYAFWGEAYGVIGAIGIYVMAMVIALLFQIIRVEALKRNLTGPLGVWLFAGLYEGLWLTRSDFAHFFKGYIAYDLTIILLVYGTSKFILTRSRAQRRLRPLKSR